MKILGIDTSTKSLGVAVAEDDKLLASCNKIFGLRHSQDLMPTVKGMLKEMKLGLEDLDGYAVSIGPGSFTGLRVGVTAVKTLALVTKKPVIAVPTLDVISQNVLYYPGVICPILDAKKQKVYAALYKNGAKGLRRISKYMLLSIEELLPLIKTDTLFLGDGLGLYAGIIKKEKGKKAEFAHPRLWLPRPENVAFLGLEKLKKGKKDNPLRLVPLYLHPKECNVTK